jgi:RimJ/RimL family protein N-acetyltransferase
VSIFADEPTLRGELVVLRPFTAGDIEAMGAILADPDVLRLTGSVHTSDAARSMPAELDDQTRQWYRTRHEHHDRLDLAVVDRIGDRCVGEVVLNELSEANASCNFRILLGPSGRDRGFGSEAIRLTLDHAFATTVLHRIELAVFEFNPRALRVYERVGFVIEGRRREAFSFDGERYDEIIMSILRPEWASRR